MKHRNRWMMIVFLIIAALPLTACAQKPAVASNPKPAVVEPIEGSEFKRVVVTEKAAQRLGIQTAPVRQEQRDGAQRLVVPYAAVIYGLHGETWAYTNPEPLVFVRDVIKVDHIDGDMAILLEGPPVDTAVVTVGGAELYGTETGVSK
jgi:hypothetical protein